MIEVLCEYAEHYFRLSKPDKSGVSLRDHYEQLARTTGQIVPELEPPVDLPFVVEHVWEYWSQLHSGRSNNGFGPNPLGWQEIQAWATLTGTRLRSWEITALKRLDVLYLIAHQG